MKNSTGSTPQRLPGREPRCLQRQSRYNSPIRKGKSGPTAGRAAWFSNKQ
jgi:hypothetical protein